MRRLFQIALILSLLAVGLSQATEIAGNRAFSDDDLTGLVNFGLPDDSLAAAITAIYEQAGYFNAKIERITVNSRGERIIKITEGKPALIGSIHLETVPDDTSLAFDDLAMRYRGKAASEKNLEMFAGEYIALLSEMGRPFASGRWRDFSFDDKGDISAVFQVLAGPRTYISGVRYDGIKRTRPETLGRVTGINNGIPYSEDLITESERALDRLPYIEVDKPFAVEPRGDGDSSRIIYSLRELPSTRFDGAGGLATVGEKTQFVGRLDLEFGDIFGTGRAFGLFWSRKDRHSKELKLTYLEPFVLRSALDLRLEAFQLDRDSSFIRTGGAVGISHAFGTGLNAGLWLTIERTAPEAESLVTGSVGRSLRLEFDYDKTDRSENPRAGYGIMTSVNYRYRSNNESDSTGLPTKITSVGTELRYFLKASERAVGAARISAWGIASSDGTAPLDELRFLGGFDNLRGYAENRFPAYRYFMASLEPRLVSGRYSRAYLFLDMAAIKPSQDGDYEFQAGYGLGLVVPSTLGQFKLEVGWGRDGFPKEAVFNFGLAGRF